MHHLIWHLQAKEHLSFEQVERAVELLLSSGVSDAEKANFLRAFREKGETADEIMAFVKVLLKRANDPKIVVEELSGPLLDISGTGGDRLEIFNVSTTAMFILAAAGVVVVKHGNRGVTTRCGSADAMEALDLNIHLLPPSVLRQCIKEVGFGYIFAQDYHPSFKVIAPIRELLKKEGGTVFNKLGPLLNPSSPPYQLAGVFSAELLPHYAHVFRMLGRKHAWVVHGSAPVDRGMDKISICGQTKVRRVSEGDIEEAVITPETFGLEPQSVEELKGGSPSENAEIIEGILRGTLHGPKRDFVLANAAAGLVIVRFARNLQEGFDLASKQIENGKAFRKLTELRRFSAEHPAPKH
jgi:anthranilate phosphoribosyltransferase